MDSIVGVVKHLHIVGPMGLTRMPVENPTENLHKVHNILMFFSIDNY